MLAWQQQLLELPIFGTTTDDLEREWLFRQGSYDLVNIRFMFPVIKDWPTALRQAYRTLKPGGYIELSGLELHPTTTLTLNEDPEIKQPIQVWQWLSILETAMAKSGFDSNVSKRFKHMLEDAGFVDIVETKFDAPCGAWDLSNRKNKVVGFWHFEQLKQGYGGL